MNENFTFDMPKQNKSIIKVVGVGGGGSNAVRHMFNQGIKDVEFVIANTDIQALNSSTVPHRIQIGLSLTEGLGAGANPEVGKNAALESKNDIREMLSDNTKMVFITAGMGGGTGTGAAPVIAQIARDLDILTVGIVTAPFSWEGPKKIQAANKGIEELKNACDTVLVISNDKLRDIYGNLGIRTAFSHADSVLSTAAKSIAEIITVTSNVNVDFQDVKTVMKNSGPAVMGSGTATGENRALRAAEEALLSPLLNNTDITGAQKILFCVSYSSEQELTMDELSEITDFIRTRSGDNADMIWGEGTDDTLGESLRVTVIATGFNDAPAQTSFSDQKKVFDLETTKEVKKEVVYVNPTPVQPKHVSLFDQVQKPTLSQNQPTQPEKQVPVSNTTPAEDKTVFNLDGSKYQVTDLGKSSVTNDYQTPNQNVDPNQISLEDRLEMKRRKLVADSQERIRQLQNLNNITGNKNVDADSYEIPSYIRRNVNLHKLPNASNTEISRYNLNDSNEILGDNKFLHDNVD